jgi:RNA polymerase sigma-70 factor (ECF subfamily)
MNDAELVRRTLVGQTDAYADLSRRWAARITAICHARVRRADVADDLAQETLLRGFRALGSLTDPNKVGTWLMGIAHRACLDWLKAKERTTVTFSALSPDHSLDQLLTEPELNCMLEDERRKIMAEIEDLPEDYRQAVMLYYYDDLTYRDLAQLLGVSTATINARLTKARAILRERLANCRSIQ